MDEKELKKILKQHKIWLDDNSRGKEAYLQHAYLRHANLRHANLQDADLQYADLQYADLQYANLRHADLRYADLRDADLRHADLRYADLQYADLRDADLRHANMDFSMFPLWCGSFNIKNADRIAMQLLGHLARMHVVDKQLQQYLKAIPKKYSNDLCKRHHCVDKV